MLLTIWNIAAVFAGVDATICEDDSYTLSGSGTNYRSVLWTSSGDGLFDDNTLVL